MRLGDFKLTVVSGGNMCLDGGAMFGVVPKPMWSRQIECDDRNRIVQATNCLVVETGSQTVLIDTGYGSKLPEKQRRILQAESGDPLTESLSKVGVQAVDVDLVVLTHLHFDHAGGVTAHDTDGESVASFPNAEVVVQQGEWDLAMSNALELRGAYPQDELRQLAEVCSLRLIQPDEEVTAGIRTRLTPGHTDFHQSILIENAGETAVFLGDVCPTTRHLRTAWCMAYDTRMIETRRQKARLLGEIADNGWLACFGHDPDTRLGRLARDDDREFRVFTQAEEPSSQNSGSA